MQLNEVIEENSIATISKRTRLSVENIEKLVHRDFSDMKRVKALGFISILEREFGIELSALKKECAEYFSSYPDEEFDAKLVVTVPESSDRITGKASKFLMLLILFAIGYGAWYFFANKGDTQDTNTTGSSTSFIGSIVNQAQEWLGNSSALDTDNVPVSTEGVWAESDTEKNTTQSTSQEAQANAVSSQDQNSDEVNDSAAEEQIIREVKEEQKEIIAQERGPSNTDKDLSDDIPSDESLAVEVPSMVNETNADEIVSIEKKSAEQSEVASNPKPRKEKQAASSSIGMGIVTLHPTKKVWVGYTDLSTMKRAAKVIEEDIDFDTSSGSWILVSGHNAIDFVIKGKATTPEKKGKNYFLIKDGKVKDISQEEFQKLNKSTVW
jgi:hypothetical protein